MITVLVISGNAISESMTLGGNSTRYELKHLQELHSENRELNIQLRELVDRANTGIEELKWRVDRNEHAISTQANKLDKDIWEFHQDFLFEGVYQCNYLYDYVRYDTVDKEEAIKSNTYFFESTPPRFKDNPCKRRTVYDSSANSDGYAGTTAAYGGTSDQPDIISWEKKPIPEFPRPSSTTTTMTTASTQTSSAGITSYDLTPLIILSYSIYY
jgi:hypothetical protein